MEIRKLKQEEVDFSLKMSEFAFQYELSDEERDERRKWVNPAETWVAAQNGELYSKVTIFPFTTYIAGKEWAMGGVSGVATWPEHRRSGLVRDLLLASLKEMKENGQLVSYLFPFSIPFYRKFGWELFAEKRSVTIPKEKLPKRKQTTGYVKRVDSDSEIIADVYETWACQFNGAIKRHSEWWDRSIFKRKKGQVAVYYDAQQRKKGYLIYKVKDEVLTVHEIVWLNHEARTGLWTFISNHDSMIKEAVVNLPSDDGTIFLLDDPHVEQKVSSYFMARVVDVTAFLRQFPFTATSEKPIILHLEDSFCDWNTGTYIIKPNASGGEPLDVTHHTQKQEGASCQHPPQRGLSMDIQSFSAVFMNAQPVDVLYEAEKIMGPLKEAERLTTILPHHKPFIYDFF
ncbi:GNAT family N-acetyltransferase [Alteribacter populi]|uniref:GNAT family N-acetyltransferase n=1 Tax=Alteribacter populi TaxID=2011011 RepID=UPI0018E1E1AA|nr:GNAT family N-acetyltransferase [Alteribacter populi]